MEKQTRNTRKFVLPENRFASEIENYPCKEPSRRENSWGPWGPREVPSREASREAFALKDDDLIEAS